MQNIFWGVYPQHSMIAILTFKVKHKLCPRAFVNFFIYAIYLSRMIFLYVIIAPQYGTMQV
jgi:hypothetical protein